MTYVIAEMGSSWLYGKPGTEISHGLRLLHDCAEAGASAVKVQWTSDAAKMARRRKVAAEAYAPLAWPINWHAVLADEAHDHGMQYIVTVFLPEDVAAVHPFADRYKVASLEWRSGSLRDALDNQDKPVIYSVGGSDGGELRGAFREKDWVLHCTSAYPCPPCDMNLAVLDDQTYEGLSDHSGRVETGAFAVMRGAKVLEVHVRLFETPPKNPDHPHSLDPAQFDQYVSFVHLAEMMVGDGKKRVMPSERGIRKHRVRR